MIVPTMFRLVFFLFLVIVLISRLEATQITDVDGTTYVPKSSALNFSEISLENKLKRFFGTPDAIHRKNMNHRKIIKRETVDYANENVTFQIELGLYGYCKMLLFVIIRIFFGIAIDVSKVKAVIFKPIGPAIAIFCNFLLLPLVNWNISINRFKSSNLMRIFIIAQLWPWLDILC